MNIVTWIIFGAIAGWLASLITSTSEGVLGDIILGIVGALIGGWIMRALGYGGVSGFNLYSFVVAILGAVVLLLIVKAFQSKPVT
jgi:uncharacterized membrane protein YeaQ/YmgE (transglycosylase-associated protein family)